MHTVCYPAETLRRVLCSSQRCEGGAKGGPRIDVINKDDERDGVQAPTNGLVELKTELE